MTLGMVCSQSLLLVVIRGHSWSLDADGYADSLSFNHYSLSNQTLKSESSDGKYIE